MSPFVQQCYYPFSFPRKKRGKEKNNSLAFQEKAKGLKIDLGKVAGFEEKLKMREHLSWSLENNKSSRYMKTFVWRITVNPESSIKILETSFLDT